MIKTKIYGIGNSGELTYIIVKKNKYLIEWLKKLLEESFGINYIITNEFKDKKGRWVMRKRLGNRMIDKHEGYNNKDVRVDIFHGKNKVFITLVCQQKTRKTFMKKLIELSNWTKKGNKS